MALERKREHLDSRILREFEDEIYCNRHVLKYKSVELQSVAINYSEKRREFEMDLIYDISKYLEDIVSCFNKLDRILYGKFPPGKGFIKFDRLGRDELIIQVTCDISTLTHFVTFLSPCVRGERLKMRYLKAISMPLLGFVVGALCYVLGLNQNLCMAISGGFAWQGVVFYLQDKYV